MEDQMESLGQDLQRKAKFYKHPLSSSSYHMLIYLLDALRHLLMGIQ